MSESMNFPSPNAQGRKVDSKPKSSIDLKEERLKNLSEFNIPNAGLSDEEIKQILQNQKLRELVEKTIEDIGNLEKYFAMIFCYGIPDKFLPLGTKSYENTKPIPWVNWDEVHAKLQKILEVEK